MSTAIANPEVRVYLDAVRSHLSDIPDRDLDDLLEDLEGHLLEVAAEDDGTLEDRLGPPAVYAEELRASAGLPSRDPSDRQRRARRLVLRFERSPLGRAVDAAARSSAARALRAFLPELRPGWWVLRGYLVVTAFALFATETPTENAFIAFTESAPLGLIALLGAIWLSILIGRASTKTRTGRRSLIVMNGFIIAMSTIAIAQAGDHYYYGYEQVYESRPWLAHADGTPILNLCPYTSDGKPLTGVLLFDQDGRAIMNTAESSFEGFPFPQEQPRIRNAYPRDLLVPDPITGEPKPVSCPAIPTQGIQPTVPPGSTPGPTAPGPGD